ncbi:MAG: HaeII family restriction endonuclease [Candidatus Wallbacteria bacterium]
MDLKQAKEALDSLIKKARVHLYKPIQIAEILHHDRIYKDIDLSDIESYRNKSKKWRDEVCKNFLGRTSTSSARYQDDVFNENAIPPSVLVELGKLNREKNGIVEAYIYTKFFARYDQMSSGLDYCLKSTKENFKIDKFIDLFRSEPGLKRSIDKIYEIIVYSLFSVLVQEINVTIEISFNNAKINLLKEFEDFAKLIIGIDSTKRNIRIPASINRVGVTNAADRGLDMWSNFGIAIQIKHLSLDEELAENIVTSITADRIVIVCKDSEEKVIISLLNQIGWKAKIQSIITESNLLVWYEKALRGKYSMVLGNKLLEILALEIKHEFPTADSEEFEKFYFGRKYDQKIENF